MASLPNGIHPCEDMPIFMPGADYPEASEHDADAIYANPGWVTLTADRGKSDVSRWYEYVENQPNTCRPITYDTAISECDEYPFHSTTQAGPGASLRVISAVDNSGQGGVLRSFYASCGIVTDTEYLVVPTVAAQANPDRTLAFEALPTDFWCGRTP